MLTTSEVTLNRIGSRCYTGGISTIMSFAYIVELALL